MSALTPDPAPGCVFCDLIGEGRGITDHGFVVSFEPLNPVTPGHLLVVPKQHVPDALAAPEVTAIVPRREGDGLALPWTDQR